jgi:hypothetical protein
MPLETLSEEQLLTIYSPETPVTLPSGRELTLSAAMMREALCPVTPAQRQNPEARVAKLLEMIGLSGGLLEEHVELLAPPE